MNVLIQPGTARGTVAAPPSKSMAHRLLICAALSEGESTVYGVDRSEDILATSDYFPCIFLTFLQIRFHPASQRIL